MNRHIHLDPVGGIAGDMFAAALLDAFPELLSSCLDDLQDSGVLEHVDVSLQEGKSQSLAVRRFRVANKHENPRATGHYTDLKKFLSTSRLEKPVLERALSILHLLGVAESRVHGVALEDVHFHEVADWDSIADIVAAASLIERSDAGSWSCSAIPVGSGFVKTEHGMLPVPAPATLALLDGLPSWDDGEPGERVTPTGAAIVKYLFLDSTDESCFSRRPSGRIRTSGMGAGQRALESKPNILRCTLIERLQARTVGSSEQQAAVLSLAAASFEHETDQIAQLSFAIDDMSSEELAVSLQYLRQSDGVLDVSHQISFGKKGRVMFDVVVLCVADTEPDISRLCFSETSTLGLRVQFVTRRILKREQFNISDESDTIRAGAVGIKRVQRPLPAAKMAESSANAGSQNTLKVESNDLRRIPGLYARRQRAAEFSLKARDVAPTTGNGLGVESDFDDVSGPSKSNQVRQV